MPIHSSTDTVHSRPIWQGCHYDISVLTYLFTTSICLWFSLDVSVESSQSSFVRRPSRRRQRRLSACSDSQCDSMYSCC